MKNMQNVLYSIENHIDKTSQEIIQKYECMCISSLEDIYLYFVKRKYKNIQKWMVDVINCQEGNTQKERYRKGFREIVKVIVFHNTIVYNEIRRNFDNIETTVEKILKLYSN